MNAIQLKNTVDFYLDLTRAARLTFAEYNIAINNTIEKFVYDLMGDPQQRTPDNFQWVGQIRDDLYTLIKSATPTLSSGTSITTPYYTVGVSTYQNPADYYAFVRLNVITSGKTIYARPTSENEIGPLLEDSFRHPTDVKVFYTENSAGVTIYRGSTAPTSASLTYIKTPATFSCGAETQLISAGATLTNALTYYATEVSVYNGVTYQVGAAITGTGASLTSGQVILSSNVVTCDLPDRTHEEIALRSAIRMLGPTVDTSKLQAILASGVYNDAFR